MGTDNAALKQLINDSMEYAVKKDADTTNIYGMHQFFFWEIQAQKQPREMQTVILDQNKAEMIIEDIQEFKKSG